jgi:hypothetical protein
MWSWLPSIRVEQRSDPFADLCQEHCGLVGVAQVGEVVDEVGLGSFGGVIEPVGEFGGQPRPLEQLPPAATGTSASGSSGDSTMIAAILDGLRTFISVRSLVLGGCRRAAGDVGESW